MAAGPELTNIKSPRVKAARRLAKRAFRERDRAFLAEGPQAVREAVALDGVVTQMFVTAEARARHPDVTVDLRPTKAPNPAMALLDASTEAGLLVVSRHDGNVLTRRLFSSVGDAAVREAPCPAAVVPE